MAGIEGIVSRLEARLGAAAGPPVPLEGGITNRNFRVRLGEAEYVIRLPGKDTGLLGIDRDAERLAQESAARLGLAPELVYADELCLVSRFVAGAPMAIDSLRADPAPVGRALRAFHAEEIALPTRFWVPDLLEQYARVVSQRGGILPAAFDSARGLAASIAEVLPLADPAPCHNDLLPANVLGFGGRVMLVDWEYAGMGHPYFDLGNLAVNCELDRDGEERLLEAYLGRGPRYGQWAALRLMRIMSDVREAAWGVVQAAVSELDFDFASYAARHYQRLTLAAQDARFGEWLDAADV